MPRSSQTKASSGPGCAAPATPRSDRSKAAALRSRAAKSPSLPKACTSAGASGPSPSSRPWGSGRRRRRRWSLRPGCCCCGRAACSRTPERTAGIRIAAHLHRQPVRAAPGGGGEIGAQDHLRRGRDIRRAVARQRLQGVEAGSGGLQRVGDRQGGALRGVAVGLRDVGRALPDDIAEGVGDLVGGVILDVVAEAVVAQERDGVALGQPHQPQLDRGDVGGGQRHRRRLVARQHEQARVEQDAGRTVRHLDRQRGVLGEREAVLRRAGRRAGSAASSPRSAGRRRRSRLPRASPPHPAPAGRGGPSPAR